MKKTDTLNLLEILILLGIPMLSYSLGLAYIILVILIILVSWYFRKEKIADYGFRPVQAGMLLLAAGTGIAFGLADNYLLEPLVNRITGKSPDLSTFANIRGNLAGMFTLLAIGWVIGGFFEEFFFRGYLLNRINLALHSRPAGKWIGIAVTSIAFAIAHLYQDTGGMINTFYFSVILGLLFYFFKRNVWYAILVHGFYDTVGIIFLYLGK
jgi:hypothetical protein